MEHRGVKYAITQRVQPNAWKWSVLVGQPEVLRMGEAETDLRAEIEVKTVIDCAIAMDEMLGKWNR